MLERFEAHHFRCFERVELRTGGGSVGLVGPNAAGKTSILEGLYFLSYGRSFRTTDRRQLVRAGAGAFRLSAEIEDVQGHASLSARWTTAVPALTLGVNNRAAAGVGELATRLRAHLVDPSVHRLIEGGPPERRRLLDTGVFHVERNYLRTWRLYRRVLKQRNAALRGPHPKREVSAWDVELLTSAAEVDAARAAYVNQWSKLFRSNAAAFGLFGASLEYRPGWSASTEMRVALQEALGRDIESRVTSVGPHRADVAILLEGRPARRLVSRGQQKLLASALVLSQIKLVQSAGHTPLLLLDDPAAELDVDNLGKFFGVVRELPVQIIATATFPAALEALPNLQMFHVKPDNLVAML